MSLGERKNICMQHPQVNINNSMSLYNPWTAVINKEKLFAHMSLPGLIPVQGLGTELSNITSSARLHQWLVVCIPNKGFKFFTDTQISLQRDVHNRDETITFKFHLNHINEAYGVMQVQLNQFKSQLQKLQYKKISLFIHNQIANFHQNIPTISFSLSTGLAGWICTWGSIFTKLDAKLIRSD